VYFRYQSSYNYDQAQNDPELRGMDLLTRITGHGAESENAGAEISGFFRNVFGGQPDDDKSAPCIRVPIG